MYIEIFIGIHDDEITIRDPYGYNDKILPSKVEEIMPYLEAYIKNHTDEEISQENFQNLIAEKHSDIRKQGIKRLSEGYVYLLSCEDKYKIGYSKNVERRIKQLDTRPYPLTLETKIYSDVAYDIEQYLHRRLSKYRLQGEWYKFDNNISIEDFEDVVLEIEKRMKGSTI